MPRVYLKLSHGNMASTGIEDWKIYSVPTMVAVFRDYIDTGKSQEFPFNCTYFSHDCINRPQNSVAISNCECWSEVSASKDRGGTESVGWSKS